MSLQDRKNKILPMVLVDLENSNPKQPFDRLALFAEDGTPIVPGSLGGGGGTGPAGKSAYQVWLDAGNTGTVNTYLASLKGAKGDAGTNGTDGADGDSAYDIWLANGNTGDVNAYLASLKGVKGDKGDPGNTELGYAEITANSSVVTASTYTPITALTETVTVGARPVAVIFSGTFANSTAVALNGHVAIFRDGTMLNASWASFVASQQFAARPIPVFARDAPSAGDHTYDIRVKTEGTGGIYASVETGSRACLQVVEC